MPHLPLPEDLSLPPINKHSPWLAPVAGYSDLAFRLLCREYGAAVTCTEMISIKGIYYSLKQNKGLAEGISSAALDTLSSAGTWKFLASTSEDSPLVVQLFGAEPDLVEPAIGAVQKFLGNKKVWFDLNMGCSVPKVTKTGSGAALLKTPELACKMAEAIIACVGKNRAGFKLRLGWQAGDDIYLNLAKELESLGAGWITLHPRYARQGFSGTAHWPAIANLKHFLKLPIIASGDILSASAAVKCLQETNANGLMFARGALDNPQIFTDFISLLKFGEEKPQSANALVKLIKRHIFLAREYSTNKSALSRMRGFIPRYAHNFVGVKELRQQLATCQHWDNLDIILDNFLKIDKH